jgi:uncharacterized membrane protein YcaP (DUF421 family)
VRDGVTWLFFIERFRVEIKAMAHLLVGSNMILHHMFQLSVPVTEKLLRPVVIYVFLVVLLRIFGKRELAQLNPFDLVVLLSLSNTVQNALIGEDNSVTGGLIGAFTLVALNYLVIRYLFKHRRLDQILEGKPTTLIENGRVNAKGLARELLTRPELLTVLHRQGFSRLDEVERCVLEPGGTFFVKGKEPPPVEQQHKELLARLDLLSRQIEGLKRGNA